MPTNTNPPELQKDSAENELLRFAQAFIKWREGPEGPEVLFQEGNHLLEWAREIVLRH